MKYRLDSSSLSDTHALADWLYRAVQKFPSEGVTIGLSGPLGSGKTEFVRGFVGASGSLSEVVSPTYVLESIYELGNGRAICHWDLYRLSPKETEIGLNDERDDPRNIVIVEWPERVPWLAELVDIRVTLSYTDPRGEGSATVRRIEIEAEPLWEERVRMCEPMLLAELGIIKE